MLTQDVQQLQDLYEFFNKNSAEELGSAPESLSHTIEGVTAAAFNLFVAAKCSEEEV